ncbi:MAG TPA: DUF308 domain-containing protein [Bradyrhizobium sp.]|jgi:hypothetical protein|nr:DUF308 domain-containing protein [Bradyrhizobium sp.]
MMVMLLVAGIVVLAAGIVAIVAGIPVKEFSLGNTLILAGTIGASTGVTLIGLSMVVRELQNIVRLATPRPKAAELPASSVGNQPASALDRGEGAAPPSPPASAAPLQEGAASRDHASDEAMAASAEPAAAKPRRNLLFSSSRKDRERATARGADQPAPEPAVAPPPTAPKEAAAASFDDAWPQSERGRSDPALRRARMSSAPEADAAPKRSATEEPVARSEEPPPVTVLKSGVVDGMAYSLYSDGSIEAQMPEGMMRFASIDELRSHLDQRP